MHAINGVELSVSRDVIPVNYAVDCTAAFASAPIAAAVAAETKVVSVRRRVRKETSRARGVVLLHNCVCHMLLLQKGG